jgi:hypothetical protein
MGTRCLKTGTSAIYYRYKNFRWSLKYATSGEVTFVMNKKQ